MLLGDRCTSSRRILTAQAVLGTQKAALNAIMNFHMGPAGLRALTLRCVVSASCNGCPRANRVEKDSEQQARDWTEPLGRWAVIRPRGRRRDLNLLQLQHRPMVLGQKWT